MEIDPRVVVQAFDQASADKRPGELLIRRGERCEPWHPGTHRGCRRGPGGILRESARLRDARLAPRAPLEEVPELGLEGVLSSAAVSHPKSPLMETVAPSEILSSLRLRVFVLPACTH